MVCGMSFSDNLVRFVFFFSVTCVECRFYQVSHEWKQILHDTETVSIATVFFYGSWCSCTIDFFDCFGYECFCSVFIHVSFSVFFVSAMIYVLKRDKRDDGNTGADWQHWCETSMLTFIIGRVCISGVFSAPVLTCRSLFQVSDDMERRYGSRCDIVLCDVHWFTCWGFCMFCGARLTEMCKHSPSFVTIFLSSTRIPCRGRPCNPWSCSVARSSMIVCVVPVSGSGSNQKKSYWRGGRMCYNRKRSRGSPGVVGCAR